MSGDESQIDRRNSPFAPTRWSLVLAAADTTSPHAAVALQQLCSTYWLPLYLHVRRLGYREAEAQDLTQAFFVRVLERNLFAASDKRRGRFRTFLLTALQNFLTNEWQRDQTLKRGGSITHFPMDFLTAEQRFLNEPAISNTTDLVFDRQWAITVLEEALATVEARQRELGKQLLFEALVPCITASDEAPQYREIAATFQMSIAAVKKEVSRLRGQFAQAVREQVASTMPADGQVDEEIRELFKALQR